MEFAWLRSLIGIVVLLGLAVLLSSKRTHINPRTVISAFGLQFLLGALVLYWPTGKDILLAVSTTLSNIFSYAEDGIVFMFGEQIGGKSLGFIFAVHILPVIVFFSSLIAVLYYLGIMGKLISIFGGGLRKLTGTSKPESMCAAANIVVGQAEAPLVVKPFLPTMTKSELFAVMVGGMATVAGAIIAGLAGIGVELKYLIAASFMAAPGGLMMAKIFMPETNEPKNELEELSLEASNHVNVIDAAADGAADGMKFALSIGAMLIAFIALIGLFNGILGAVGGWFGYEGLTLQIILGYVFSPIAYIIGVPWSEAQLAGSFLGQKLILNEFVAYLDFINHKENLSELTQVVVTFGLCGFANLSSIAILIGGIGSMAPNRRHDLASLGLKAVLAATMANLMSAAIAGFFIAIT
ncbi:MAG: NupC/NupG family nucleoside CNT transporter [Gammaproteobacteria bacterium]|nr:NupC/NupG family nucleoside CNT transporter [Gammaproteobacteria bacterium]